MAEIIAFIQASWLQWLFAGLMGALAWGYRNVSNQMKAYQKKSEAIAEGVQSLLRENIVGNYNKYSEKGYCPIYAKESIKKVYHAYHDLGGNDVASGLYEKLLKMPEEQQYQS